MPVNFQHRLRAVELLLWCMEYDRLRREAKDPVDVNGAEVLLRSAQDQFDALDVEERKDAANLVKHGFKHLTTYVSVCTFKTHREFVENDRMSDIKHRLDTYRRDARFDTWTKYLLSLKPGDEMTIEHSFLRGPVKFVKVNPGVSFQYSTVVTIRPWGNNPGVTTKTVMVKWADFTRDWRHGNIKLPREFEDMAAIKFEQLVADSNITPEDRAKVEADRGKGEE